MTFHHIEVVPIKVEEKHILKNIYPLYLHDLSPYNGEDINQDGLYDIDFLDLFWKEEGLLPYFIKKEEKMIGFILVQNGKYGPPTGEDFYISEFFILRKYRRSGVGTSAFKELIESKPGTYLLGQLPSNLPAIKFWKNVYKALNIEFEEFVNNELGSLIYQRFEVHVS
ncbi:MAG: GNAT family N-acetyltransferase [Heyndrickxia sp.]